MHQLSQALHEKKGNPKNSAGLKNTVGSSFLRLFSKLGKVKIFGTSCLLSLVFCLFYLQTSNKIIQEETKNTDQNALIKLFSCMLCVLCVNDALLTALEMKIM